MGRDAGHRGRTHRSVSGRQRPDADVEGAARHAGSARARGDEGTRGGGPEAVCDCDDRERFDGVFED